MKYVTSWERMAQAEGIQLGEARGEAKTLLKLLKLKFNNLPEWVEEKVIAADKVQLDYWVERILTAQSVDGLLAETDCKLKK